MRRAIAGIAHTGSKQRQAAPRPSHPAATAAAPAPRTPPRRPRRQPAAAAKPVAEPGWIARGFARKRRQPLPSHHPIFAYGEDGRYTPASHPSLTPEACAILNMPAEECPPELISMLLAAVARDIAAGMPPELGMTDPQAVFATLWGQLGGVLDTLEADVTPAAASAEPLDPAPAKPPALPEASSAMEPDDTACATITEPAAALDVAPVRKSTFYPRRSIPIGWRKLRRDCRTRPRRAWRDRWQCVPLWRLYEVASTGPP